MGGDSWQTLGRLSLTPGNNPWPGDHNRQAQQETPVVTNKKFTGDLNDYDEKYIRCRGIRNHTWRFETDFNVATGPRGRIMEFTRTLHCAACTTNRLDTYEVTKSGKFKFKNRKYEYADGYQVHRGNPIDTEVMRDALLMREMRASLDSELMNRLLNMRPDAQAQPLLKVVGE